MSFVCVCVCVCVAVLAAINDDSVTVPTLLTDYILNGLTTLSLSLYPLLTFRPALSLQLAYNSGADPEILAEGRGGQMASAPLPLCYLRYICVISLGLS